MWSVELGPGATVELYIEAGSGRRVGAGCGSKIVS